MSAVNAGIFVDPGDLIEISQRNDQRWPFTVSIDHGQARIYLDHDAAVRLHDVLSRGDLRRRAQSGYHRQGRCPMNDTWFDRLERRSPRTAAAVTVLAALAFVGLAYPALVLVLAIGGAR